MVELPKGPFRCELVSVPVELHGSLHSLQWIDCLSLIVWSILKPQGVCRVGVTPMFDWKLFVYPGPVGSGINGIRLAESGLNRFCGIVSLGNGLPVVGSKIVSPVALKLPCFSAGVGRFMNVRSGVFRRYHSTLKWKNVRFLPLYSFGIRTGPPTVKP